jgi:hypothetical protein
VTSCERGDHDLRSVLTLPPVPGARGTLTLKLAPGVPCELSLPHRHVRVLLILVDAWVKDEGVIDAHRGFRTVNKIGELLASTSRGNKMVRKKGVCGYVFEIRTEIKNAVSLRRPHDRRDLRVPVLIENQSRLGYRIGPGGLEIVQHCGQAAIAL